MVNLDISQNNLSNQTIAQDSQTSSFSAKRAYHAQNVQTMAAVLLANGYSQARIDAMTKNDLIYAFRLIPEGSLPNVGPVA
jgi:hypothetical protein